MIKSGTVVLVLAPGPDQRPILIESLSDDQEVEFFEAALRDGHVDPVWALRQIRKREFQQQEEFADYVEDLVSEPYCKVQLREHAFRWFRSRLNLEKFVEAERQARQVIAEYAFAMYQENPSRTNFILFSPQSEVRIRILLIPAFGESGHAQSA